MAKIILSGLVDSLTGKLGGSVFQNTVGGLQMRTRVSPRDPKSTPQQRSRASWSVGSLTWNDLNPTELASWNSNAPVDTSGVSFFLNINQRIASVGQPLLREYTGTDYGFEIQPQFDSLAPNDFTFSIQIGNPVLIADEYLAIFATRQLPAGISFITPSEYVLLVSYSPGTIVNTPIDITALYQAKYGVLVSGQRVGLAGFEIDVATGSTSGKGFSNQLVA